MFPVKDLIGAAERDQIDRPCEGEAMFKNKIWLCCVPIVAALFWTVAFADGISDFYKGRKFTIVVGFSAGGGFDLYARLLSRHISKHIPGSPTVVVQNMPGAGSIKAALYVLDVAPKDGTVIGLFGRTVPVAPLMTDRNFDGRRFEWVGSITDEVSLCVGSSASRVKTWQDILAMDFVAGGEGHDSDLDINANLLKNVFGARIKLISGYPGSNDVRLAIQRGEVDGMCGLSYSTFKNNYAQDWRDKKINILVQVSLNRNPELKDVPFVGDFATAEQMDVLRLLLEPQAMARPFAAPAGLPADILSVLRTAFNETMTDPEFRDDARKLNLDVRPMRGEDIKALISGLYGLPKNTGDKARAATGG